MTYISKKEKVFDLPDPDEGSSTSLAKSSDHRLKIFPSVYERGSGMLEECQKYQPLYGAVNEKEPKATKTGFKYIPIDVLLTILMAEKDAYIQELLERQEKCTCGEKLFKAKQFDDSEDDKEALIRKDAEVVALKNRNVVLESELEECRDVLSKAMHKLENVEGILNENSYLKDKLKYAEEMIHLLEESKKALEIEMENRAEGSSVAVENCWNSHSIPAPESWGEGDSNILHGLYSERESLKQEIEVLQRELNNARVNMEELDILKRQSETVLLNLEEMSRENECYRKRLEGTKKLEKCVQDLKKQAINLNEKYKRESFKSNEQVKKINLSNRELEILREERDKLEKKVTELSSFESEYYNIKNKLSQVESIIEENEMLTSKLTEMGKIECENEHLKDEIGKLKYIEAEYNACKEKMDKMESELEAQEEEIKGLVSQIAVLSKECVDQEEYKSLKSEMLEKVKVIEQKEKELMQIPILNSQIEELREKLQKYSDDLSTYKMTTKRLQDELEAYKDKCIQLEEMCALNIIAEPNYISKRYEEKMRFKEKLGVIKELVGESSPFHVRNLDPRNEENIQSKRFKTKNFDGHDYSVASVKMKMEKELSEMLEQTNKFKELISVKDEKIKSLESSIEELKENLANCAGCQDLRNQSAQLQNDVVTLQEQNRQLQIQLDSKAENEIRIDKLESSLKLQKKSLDFSRGLVKEMEEKLISEVIDRQMTLVLSKLLKEEAFLSKKEISVRYLTEIEHIKSERDLYKTLNAELKEENQLLQKSKIVTEFTGKKALEKVLKKLKAELLVVQNLSKPELDAQCQSLQAEVKRLVDEADNLKIALDAERNLKDHLQKELSVIQKELTSATKERNKNQTPKLNATTMTTEFVDQSEEIKKTLNDIKILKEENNDFVKKIAVLQGQCKDFQDEVVVLHNNMDELDRNIREERDLTSRQKNEINALNEHIKEYEKEMADLRTISEEYNQKSIALREELTAKEAEVDKTKKEVMDLRNEIVKLNSEVETLRGKLEETLEKGAKETEKEDEAEEKEESESTILKVEKEFEDLRRKLEGCNTVEEKSLVLRTRRDNLIVKVNSFESEVEFLKKKLIECDLMKSELEQLKAERQTLNNLQMNIESEEKLLSDIFGLREQLRLQQKEIEQARSENITLKDQLQDLGKMLQVCKKAQKSSSPVSSKTELVSNSTGTNLIPKDLVGRVDSSTSCEKLKDTISIEEFKQEIARIENKHKIKVQKLKESNAKKIKMLMEQSEKDSKNQNKAYNDTLNSIKSNYESDIRKLAERHKASILRLQNLHEDEVQELNTNYETQMEAMQTLNENVVNDLTSGEAEKSKLTEKYNKEIKEIELKFQKMLKEKDNHHRIEIANLQKNLTQNINDLKETHKQDIENLSRLYDENIATLEKKHNRELKNYKRNNIKKTEIMKHKYEEKFQIMLERLKTGQEGDQETQDELQFVYLKKPTSHSDGALEFNKILQKIITEGLESISLDELMLVHCKTCFASANFFEELTMRLERDSDLVGDGCPHISLLKEDKEQLVRKIFFLEKELAIKQLETHEAIVNMDTAEKCRIEELNVLLRNEREKNAELKMLLTNQTRAQTDLKIESYMLDRQASLHETNFMEKVKELEIERCEKRRLEEELLKERNNSKRLNLLLENERQRFKSQRKKESEYIEAMRMRLEEALSHEQIMESQLDYEAQFRTKLEFELQSLQRSFNLIIDQPSTALSLESKTVKDKKNLDQFESDKEVKVCTYKSRSKVKSHKNS